MCSIGIYFILPWVLQSHRHKKQLLLHGASGVQEVHPIQLCYVPLSQLGKML